MVNIGLVSDQAKLQTSQHMQFLFMGMKTQYQKSGGDKQICTPSVCSFGYLESGHELHNIKKTNSIFISSLSLKLNAG